MALQTSTVVNFVKKHPIGVGCVVLAILLTVASSMRADSMGELETKVDELTREGERLQNNLRYGAKLDEHLATVKRATGLVRDRAINPGSLATNLQYFYRLESDLGLKLIDLRQGTPEKSKTKSEYVAVPYTVAVEGTYRQLIAFVRELESGSHYVRFLSSNLSPSRAADTVSGDPTNPTIVLSLNLQILGRS